MIETVPAALAGERVDRLVAMLVGCSRAEAAALVEGGHVQLDGLSVPAGKLRVAEGQVLTIDDGAVPGPELPVADPGVIVPERYADEDVIVLDKPPGLVVHPGSGHREGTLVHGLLARYPDIAEVGDPARPGIVHRLDRGTSGLMVVARSPLAYERLVDALSRRDVSRRYVALVWGIPESATGVVDAPIGRSMRDPTRMTVSVHGREARTGYDIASTFHDPVVAALLRCRLETGRTHQIRVHLSAIGHPVVGDPAYGGVRPGLSADRPMLHAAHLTFAHPRTGEPMSFDSPLPADMASVLARLS